MMKAITAGMMLCMASGAGMLSFDGPVTPDKMMLLCLMAGTLGSLAGYAAFGAENIKDLSRQALANIFLSVLFGPWLSQYVAHRYESELTAYLVLVVAGSVGLSGVAVLKKIGPTLLDGSTKILPLLLDGISRLGTKKSDDGK